MALINNDLGDIPVSLALLYTFRNPHQLLQFVLSPEETGSLITTDELLKTGVFL
jgi:hypothetical protein